MRFWRPRSPGLSGNKYRHLAITILNWTVLIQNLPDEPDPTRSRVENLVRPDLWDLHPQVPPA